MTAQTICLRYFQKLLKESSVFRTFLAAGSFLLRLKTIAMCFKLNIFHDNLTGNVYEHFFLRNIVSYYQNRPPSQTAFLEIISSPKYLRNGLCWSHVLIRTEL